MEFGTPTPVSQILRKMCTNQESKSDHLLSNRIMALIL